MLIELILALLLGILAGTITGLAPAIHINLVGALVLSASAFLLSISSPEAIIVFIVAMSIAHTFIDFIPSVFLGAPDEETALSVLPGHELLKQGKGYEAVFYSSLGSLLAMPLLTIIIPLFILFLPKAENIIIFFIPFILIISSSFIIFTDKNKFSAFLVFILSGFLGIAVLNSNINEPLLPLFSGLFGASSLILSIKTKITIPEQKIEKIKLNKRIIIPPIFASLLTAPLCSFIPALGSGQAATISTTLIKTTKRRFLILLGSTNILVLTLSFIVLYSIGKSRTGIAVFIGELAPKISQQTLLIIIWVIIFTTIISFFWTLYLTKIFSKLISKVNYSIISIFVLIFILIVVIIFSGFLGFLIFITSTATGVYGISTEVKRINLMGCLLIPTILIYLI
ncbi:MAG: tripartite tricarboxylate transporter permease [Candidatus Pacearchaeota archaeon]|jgi:putative membrane protein